MSNSSLENNNIILEPIRLDPLSILNFRASLSKIEKNTSVDEEFLTFSIQAQAMCIISCCVGVT